MHASTRFSILLSVGLCLIGTLDTTISADADKPLPRVPEGFTIEKVAETPLVQHPMMAGFDERGRLFIAASAGQNLKAPDLLKDPPNFIRLLEDTDGDGRFDKSTIFADKMTLPMGALWYRGALYVASPPNIWRLQDTDGDGVADKREILVDTFGFSGNAASIHGCFLGPDGRIYWCDGRHGHTFKDDQGRQWSQGKAARIFSCRPDGSDVEVFCGGGMDNPVEIDFTEEGEMLGVVNILLNPRGDCLVHWMEGGVYPRYDQEDCIAEFPRTGDLLPPVHNFGHVAVSGTCRYRSEQFGPEYRDNFFVTQFNTHKLVRVVLERSGATFHVKRVEDFFVLEDPDFHPTDVLEDADGSLLVIDTGGWFRIGCPTSQIAKPDIHGAIYRIRRTGAHQIEDPRGLTLGLEKKTPEQSVPYLDDPRPAVRERVIDHLAQVGDEAVVSLRHAFQEGSVEARRNIVWVLSRIGNETARTVLRAALSDESESVRLAAAHALGNLKDSPAGPQLARLLVSADPDVRREAATALGRICAAGRREATDQQRQRTVEALLQSLGKSVTDRMLEHALIYALIRIADREHTVPYLNDPNPQVRRAALIALDQMDGGNLTRELVVPVLDTDDPELQKTALEIIGRHEGWAKETLELLRTWLGEPELTAERQAILRGFLLAQSADPEIQQLVAETFQRPDLPQPTRLLLLEVIHRSPVEPLPTAWQDVLREALASESADVRLQAVRIVQSREPGWVGFAEGPSQEWWAQPTLLGLARNEGQAAEIRVASLLALAPRLQRLDDDLFTFLLSRLSSDVPPLQRLEAARAVSAAKLDDRQLLKLTRHLDEVGPLALPVLLQAFSSSSAQEVGLALMEALNRSSAAANLAPDELARLVQGYPSRVQTAADGLLKSLGVDIAAQQKRLAELEPLTAGGVAERGREIFFGKKAACAGCHTVAAEGGRVGPNLTNIGAIRTGRDLLEAVAFPSASFARGYRPYVIVTQDGRIHTGVISRETADTLYLRTAELAELRIPRGQIDQMRESPTSIMPKGLDQTLTRGELRDLLAFLQSLK